MRRHVSESALHGGPGASGGGAGGVAGRPRSGSPGRGAGALGAGALILAPGPRPGFAAGRSPGKARPAAAVDLRATAPAGACPAPGPGGAAPAGDSAAPLPALRQRSSMGSRNAALGDPRVESTLPRIRPAVSHAAASGRPAAAAVAVRPPPAEIAAGGVGPGLAGLAGQRRSPKGTAAAPKVAGSPVNEESDALQEISAIAGNVSRDLDRLIQRCEAFGDEDVTAVSVLREITSATYRVQENLCQTPQDEPAGLGDAFGARSEAAYDDPILARARKIATLTIELCDQMNSTSETFGVATQDSLEVASLQEITTATRQVRDDMLRLQGESWAEGVLRASPVGVGGADAGSDLDRLPSAIAGGEAADPGGAVSEAPAAAPAAAGEGAAGGAGAGPEALGGSALGGHKKTVLEKVEGLPDLEELLNHKESDDGFSDKEVCRMQTAFKRFKIPDSSDLHMGDVCSLLRYLGHVMTNKEGVFPLIRDVTTYDYLDFDEFLNFMERYVGYEKVEISKIFVTYDEDKSGEISVVELKALLSELGFIPLRAMIQEALGVVDDNGNGDLDFDEFVMFLAVYRRAEGFASQETKELRRLFDYFSQHGPEPKHKLPADQLSDALIQVFGLHVAEFTEKLEEQLQSGQGLQSSSYAVGGGGKAESLTFAEFLIFARKTREQALEKMKGEYPDFAGKKVRGVVKADNEFACADADGSGGISEEELRQAITAMGYTPLKQNLDEIFGEVDKDKNHELDFDEFFDFMLIYRQREGFKKAVVDEMRRVFERFDEEDNGEISALELADLFRELGYNSTLDEIHIFVAQVDGNNSGQLDFREFLKLMRLHREAELQKIQEVFDNHKDALTQKMDKGSLKDALAELEYAASMPLLLKQKKSLDFEAFVGLCDSYREDRVAKERKKAGFSDERIEELRTLFERFDKDKGGEIDTVELLGILEEFGWAPKSREEQAQLMKKLDTCRQRARDAGIQDVAEDGCSTIKFWTFVQLSRMLETEHQHAEEERMQRLMQELKFTQKEVEQFREIFLAKKQECADEASGEGQAGKPPSVDGLPRDAVRRLIKALGVAIIGEKKPLLDSELGGLGCGDEGLLDFFGFLQLMRWLMETGWLKS